MGTITLTDDYLKRNAARSVPGAFYDSAHKAWVLKDPTPRAAAVVLKLFPDLAAQYPELLNERSKLDQDVRPFDTARKLGLSIEAPEVQDRMDYLGLDFYPFQSEDLGFMHAVLEKHGGAYLGWERGMGKTLGACALIDSLEATKVLVVCPNTAKESVWAPEIRKWLGLEAIVLPNEKPKRERQLGWIRQAPDHARILIVHYEALALIDWKKLGVEWDLVVADEAHRIKNPKAKMTRALKKIPAHRRLALSGSIIQNHAEELFSPLQWLFPDIYRSKWRDWNDRFLDYVDSGWGKVCVGVKADRIRDMQDELGRFMAYRRKEDELSMPERVDQTMHVTLSPAQLKAYRELQESCLVELEDGTRIKAADGLAMLGKLRQIATGLDLVTNEIADSAKLDLALDLIEDSEEPTVVFTWYKAAGLAMERRLADRSIDSFRVDGDVAQKERAERIARFQEGEGRVFIGTLATLGESVTLTRATQAIFLDRSWNPSHNTQAADRIYRIGQERPVTITHIVAKGTVDELRVQPVIQSKEILRRMILGGSE